MQETWNTPKGYTWELADDILKQTHVVIGGTTGSGKSVLLHDIIYSALIHAPVTVQLALIDLKATELYPYSKLPHCIAYAEEPETAVRVLEGLNELMDKRNAEARRQGKRAYQGAQIYIVIDEIADLMQTAKAKALNPLTRIMRLGRSAGMHVIAATQNPSRSSGGGLPAPIVQNVTASIALRCRTAIESRQIIGVSGAEQLPKHGRAFYWNADGTRQVAVPMTSEQDIDERIDYWMHQKPIRHFTNSNVKTKKGLLSWLGLR